MRLEGKDAIVTGAGSGTGRAIALGFAREGAGVIAADIDVAAAERTAAQIRESGGRAIAVRVDVADRGSVEAMLAGALVEFGQIHVLASNAGVGSGHHFLELPEDEWDRMLDVNLKGQYMCGQVVGRHMVAAGGGSISINTASQLAEGAANPNQAHYLASKGGSRMLTRGMAVDLAPHNARVNALALRVTITNLTRQRMEDADYRRWAPERIPLGRFAQPDDLVGAAFFMASDESAYMTGATLVIDGGHTGR